MGFAERNAGSEGAQETGVKASDSDPRRDG